MIIHLAGLIACLVSLVGPIEWMRFRTWDHVALFTIILTRTPFYIHEIRFDDVVDRTTKPHIRNSTWDHVALFTIILTRTPFYIHEIRFDVVDRTTEPQIRNARLVGVLMGIPLMLESAKPGLIGSMTRWVAICNTRCSV
jgi:hypothetical protein